MLVDKYEIVRTAVIDLFMGMGKSERYARNLGDLAKSFAKELGIEIYDDRNGSHMFSTRINPELVNDVKSFAQNGRLSMWQN